MSETLLIPGLSAVASQYDAVICDIWGVLHDGKTAYPKAVTALRRFRDKGGRIVLLSNAPRLRAGVEEQFVRLGVPLDCYDALITSGEATRAFLEERSRTKTLKLFYLGPDRDRPMFAGLDIALVEVEEAELVLNVGPFNDDVETPEDYGDRLAAFRSRNLPMICANPDLIVQRGDHIVYCAGSLAKAYEAIGGPVTYFGKPYPAVFEAALAVCNAPKTRVLMIGDSIGTDIKGANASGLDALLILGGVHASDVGDDGSDEVALRLLHKNEAKARAVALRLQW